jgi:hypothetical protein
LKRRVIARPGLRAWLRRRVVTPFQVRELARIERRLPPPPPAAARRPVVLVLALRPWPISRAWEAVVGRLLEREGCRVVWAVCDRLMPRCDAMLGEAPEPDLCRHCVRFNRRAAEIFGVERVVLADLVPGAAAALDAAAAGGRTDDGGDPALEAAVGPSVQRTLAARPRAAGERTPGEERIRRDLLTAAERARRAAAPLLDRVRPDTVLALNGKFFAEALVIAAAAARGIPVWTYERGNRRDTLVLHRAPTAIPFPTGELIAGLDRPLDPAQAERIERYLRQRLEVGNGQVRFLPSGAPAPLPFAGEGGRRVSLFTNLIWDSSVVGEDDLFADMFAWLETTVAEVGRDPETRLVVRVHPAEVRVYWHPTRERVRDVLASRFPGGLPANVALVDADEAVDSYELLRRSDLVLVYASTVGMEAAALGRRVVAAARSSYSDAPFVVRPRTAAEYLAELSSRRREPPVPEASELARRFMYRLFFETMAPVPWVREDPTGFHAGEAAAEVPPPLARRIAAIAGGARERAAGG